MVVKLESRWMLSSEALIDDEVLANLCAGLSGAETAGGGILELCNATELL